MISKRFAYVATVATLAISLTAEADDRDKAKKEMTQGVEAYDAGNFIKAKGHFQKASEYAPTASGPYRELGKACQELRQWNEAKTAYQTYLSLKPEASDAAEIQGYVAEVEREIAKLEAASVVPGSLALSVNVSGAEISIDGSLIGKSPLRTPYKLAPGDHTLTVTKNGFEEYSSEISIVSGEEMRLKTVLDESGDAGESGGSQRKTGLGFGLLATGGLGLAAGIIGGIGALNAQADIDNIVDNNLPVEFAEFQALVDQGELFNIVTIAGYAVAAAGVGGGLYFLLRGGGDSDSRDAEDSAQLPRLQLTPTARGAGLRFTF